MILRDILQQLRIAVGSKSALQPWQLFDVICGTSTGGIIAIMLARLRMSIDEAIGHYRDFSKTVFGSPIWFSRLRSNVFGTSVYDSSVLERYMKEMAAKSDATKYNGEALLPEPFAERLDGALCHTSLWQLARARRTQNLFYLNPTIQMAHTIYRRALEQPP